MTLSAQSEEPNGRPSIGTRKRTCARIVENGGRHVSRCDKSLRLSIRVDDLYELAPVDDAIEHH